MDTLSYKTISANKATVDKQWVLVDAEGQTLGRLASKVAKLLRGKHKPSFTPHVDCGDNVIVVNAEMFGKDPARLVEKSVKGMLPKNKLGANLFRNLTVVVGTEHAHEAQKPKTINLNEFK